MKKTLILAATAAAVVAAQSVMAVPTLTISDNNGHSITIADGDGNDQNAGTGAVTFNGPLGNWSLNVSTGLSSPPSSYGNYTASNPYIDLNSDDVFDGGAGGQLTITFTADNLGPINGSLNHITGGTAANLSSDEFIVSVNGTPVTDQIVGNGLIGASQSANVTAGAESSISITAILTANGRYAGNSSFDSQLTVPDAGMTLAMLGAGLTGLAFVARRKTA